MEELKRSPEEVKKIDDANDKLFADLTAVGKKKLAADSKRVNKVLGIKNKDFTKEKLPSHIRKAYITINDKKPNELISIAFSGDWTGSDINLAGKHLILEYQTFVRNRAIRNK